VAPCLSNSGLVFFSQKGGKVQYPSYPRHLEDSGRYFPVASLGGMTLAHVQKLPAFQLPGPVSNSLSLNNWLVDITEKTTTLTQLNW